MGRAKIKKKSTFIDMTAMSDVTVLLLTFFTNVEVNIKKVSSNTVTSLMAVISMNVLFFLIFALPIAVYFKGLARLFMRSRKGLYNRETYFIEAVSQFINLISVVVIRNNRQCTCQDTECRIDQRLGNTL